MQRRCKLFVYGGCKGNGNNFLSEIQCLQRCGDESQLALLPVEEKITTEIGKRKQLLTTRLLALVKRMGDYVIVDKSFKKIAKN